MMFHGTLGTLIVDRQSYQVVPETLTTPTDVGLEAVLGSRQIIAAGAARPKPAPLCEPIAVKGISLDPEIQIVHIQNWLDSIRSRKAPVADWEIGHRSVTACHLAVIAYHTRRRIRWDAKAERIIGDDEAARMMSKQYRAPWALPVV